MLQRTILLLSTLCFVSGCETVRATEALRPDQTNPERFVCETAGSRPEINPEYQIDWASVAAQPTKEAAVEEAKRQVTNQLLVQHSREKVVSEYVLKLEGVNFECFNNMQWQKDFYAGLEKPQG